VLTLAHHSVLHLGRLLAIAALIRSIVRVLGASSIGSTSISLTALPMKENANRASHGTSSFST
jgi:hypothetical protein